MYSTQQKNHKNSFKIILFSLLCAFGELTKILMNFPWSEVTFMMVFRGFWRHVIDRHKPYLNSNTSPNLWATSSRITGITCFFSINSWAWTTGRSWTSWQKWHAIKSTAPNLILHDVTMEFRIRTQTKTAWLMSRKSSSNRGIFITNTQTIMKFHKNEYRNIYV